MKVLHVIDSGGLYGAERVLLSLMKAHQEQGIEVELASIGEPGVPAKALETEAGKHGLKWRRFSLKAGPDIKGIRQVVSYAVEHGVSVIHSHGYKANTLLAILSAKTRSIPVLATLHGWTSANKWSRMRFYEVIERAVLPRLNGVIAVTEGMLSGTRLRRRLGDRLIVIHNAIEDELPPQANGQVLSKVRLALQEMDEGSVAFAMVGRLSREKDIGTCLRAIKILTGEGRSVRVFIFGDGPERESLEKLSKELGIKEYVFFLGYLDGIQLLLSEFRALIISSLTEGLPLVALEAMRSGIPVVATKVGGLPEIVVNQETGLLVAPGHPEDLAIVLGQLADDKRQAREFGEAGYQRVLEEFDFPSFSKTYFDEYQAMA